MNNRAEIAGLALSTAVFLYIGIFRACGTWAPLYPLREE